MKIVLLVLLAVPCSRGQLFDFFPRLVNTAAQEITAAAGLTRQPYLKQASATAGNTLVDAVNTLTSIPLSLSKALGVIDFPPLVSDINIVDSVNRITSGLNSGLENEDSRLSVSQLITKYGRQVEEHQVVTEDGYVLTMFRIPGNGSVAFLMHGLLGSADDYVIAGAEDSLAYLLSDAGYDVWMGNARGNKHSRKHVKRSPAEAKFWDFSWHEIGYYDVPAMIDYTLLMTGQEKLKYVGHSQGTTSFFVMCSTRPEYNEKVSLMIALSPVAYMSHAKSPIVRLLASSTPLLPIVLRALGVHEFLPSNSLVKTMGQLMCGFGQLADVVCSNIVFLVVGFSYDQLKPDFLPVLLGHAPSGAATKQFLHYGQNYVSGEFRLFDYGADENRVKYGSQVPPDYPVERITAPVSIFHSEEDWLAHPADVDKFYNRLSNCIDIYMVPRKEFNHLDFVMGKDFRTVVYDRLIKLFSYF